MIVIKNMEIPSSCYECRFAKNERSNDYGSFCECGVLEDYETINLLEHSKHPNCPLVEQEPVIDKLRAEIKEMTPTYHNPDWSITDLAPISEVLKLIDKYKAESEG